jgi:hypothetical protein
VIVPARPFFDAASWLAPAWIMRRLESREAMIHSAAFSVVKSSRTPSARSDLNMSR